MITRFCMLLNIPLFLFKVFENELVKSTCFYVHGIYKMFMLILSSVSEEH
jgi:hypothetical protein